MFDARIGDGELDNMATALEGKWRCETPLGSYDPSGVIRGTCEDCGLERSETISRLVNQGRFGRHTIAHLEGALKCARPSCGGALKMEVV